MRGRWGRERRGLTLVEMLVATFMIVLIMVILAQVFAVTSGAANLNRQIRNVETRLRAVETIMRDDLAGATAAGLVPPADPDDGHGYLEIVENWTEAQVDAMRVNAGGVPLMIDTDDVLAFTTRRLLGTPTSAALGSDPLQGGIAAAEAAEVIYFLRATGRQTFTLYRRQSVVTGGPDSAQQQDATWFFTSDVSARPGQGGVFLRNDLRTLTERRNRWGHDPANFPNLLAGDFDGNGQLDATEVADANNDGIPDQALLWPDVAFGTPNPWVVRDDILLTNVLSFDVKVFDSSIPPRGAYVDLGWDDADGDNTSDALGQGPPIGFGGLGFVVAGAGNNPPLAALRAYDTWSTTYANVSGRLTNSVDDPPVMGGQPNGIVDDAEEADPPPYARRLEGIQIRIRLLEPRSGRAREMTIVHHFAE